MKKLISTSAIVVGFFALSCFCFCSGEDSAKACTEEWRADKANFQAKGITEKAYVTQCRAGTAAAPAPTIAPPPPVAAAPDSAPGAKTAKACVEEWRADKAKFPSQGYHAEGLCFGMPRRDRRNLNRCAWSSAHCTASSACCYGARKRYWSKDRKGLHRRMARR